MKQVGFATILLATALSAADLPDMDSRRGQQVFESGGCIQCHALSGRGGTTGPDLAKIIDRGFTPATLAGTMWNHAPVMWGQMRARNVQPAPLSEGQVADLFAAFYATHYFDAPADAARGKLVFERASCAFCHGIDSQKRAPAPAVKDWVSLSNSVAMVASMWNHATTMQAELEKENVGWPVLSGQDVADVALYLRILPGVPHRDATFTIASGDEGKRLFESKGCNGCHSVEKLPLQGRTLDDMAATMWNHANDLKANRPAVDATEMSSLLGYVWASQFFTDSGSAGRGSRVFASRRCGSCHGVAGSGAPALAGGGRFTGVTIVSALWRHGPAMLGQMEAKKIRWPEFRAGEMEDLIAYINSRKK